MESSYIFPFTFTNPSPKIKFFCSIVYLWPVHVITPTYFWPGGQRSRSVDVPVIGDFFCILFDIFWLYLAERSPEHTLRKSRDTHSVEA